MAVEHAFTPTIKAILADDFGEYGKDIFKESLLIKYLNRKTRSASSGSKSRGAFGNHYAIYVLIEDYIKHGYHTSGEYSRYEGAIFTDLLTRQRQLPFGQKLQNHALNHRLNEEFKS